VALTVPCTRRPDGRDLGAHRDQGTYLWCLGSVRRSDPASGGVRRVPPGRAVLILDPCRESFTPPDAAIHIW
jgi:hypothetical protein